MKRISVTGLLVLICILVSLAACGGGGGGGGGSTTPAPTQAVLTLSTSGTGTIAGIEVTVNLPAGVTAKATAAPGNPSVFVADVGVVTSAGSATGAEAAMATFVTSTTSSTSKLMVYVAKSSGFTTGNYAVIKCDIAAGHVPAAANFSVSDFQPVDVDGAAMTSITPGLAVVMK